jgi:GT2 family glycosyltransferase
MISRQFLEAIGYLDERPFLYTEEVILGASIRAQNAVACLCTAAIVDHIQGASTGMHRRHRPLRRELDQVRSEMVYLRHYLKANLFGRSLFLLVRGADILLRRVAGRFVRAHQ